MSDEKFSSSLYDLAHLMRPDFLAQATVYGDTYGFNNHELVCYNCKTMLHVNKKFNFNVAFLDPKVGGPNKAAIQSQNPINIINAHVDTHNAQFYLHEIAQADCWTGLMVVVNGLGYWTNGQLLEDYTQFHGVTPAHFVL